MTEKVFIEKWTGAAFLKRLKKFPEGYLPITDFSLFTVNSNNLILGKELLGKIEILDSNGNSILFTENKFLAKFILYSFQNNIRTIKIPNSELEVKEAVKLYETDIDQLLKTLGTEFKKEFPKSKNFNLFANKIFKYWGLKRI